MIRAIERAYPDDAHKRAACLRIFRNKHELLFGGETENRNTKGEHDETADYDCCGTADSDRLPEH